MLKGNSVVLLLCLSAIWSAWLATPLSSARARLTPSASTAVWPRRLSRMPRRTPSKLSPCRPCATLNCRLWSSVFSRWLDPVPFRTLSVPRSSTPLDPSVRSTVTSSCRLLCLWSWTSLKLPRSVLLPYPPFLLPNPLSSIFNSSSVPPSGSATLRSSTTWSLPSAYVLFSYFYISNNIAMLIVSIW